MRIAVLSGKGGTGKTFVSVNLAAVLNHAVYIDCDVEEPNGRLFLKPEKIKKESAHVLIPLFDKEKCTGCRKCTEFCRFNALVYIKDAPKLFQGICHSCGGCKMVCPEGAVTEIPREVGIVETGYHNNLKVVTGIMNLSEESGVPVVRKALETGCVENKDVIIDCPPGCACMTAESMADADYCIIVAEPTSFGLHNMKMVAELIKIMKKPCGVVINKDMGDCKLIQDYCNSENISILMTIPYKEKLAVYGSLAAIAVEEDESCTKCFNELASIVRKEAGM